MWGWTFVVLAAALAWQARRVGLKLAFGQVLFLSLLVPTWAHLGYQSAGVNVQFNGVPIDARVAMAFVGLLALCRRPRELFDWRLTAVDLAVGVMAFVHVLADWRIDGVTLVAPLRAFGEWILPYAAGRATIRSRDDLRDLLPVALGVVLALCGVALFEAAARVNAFEWAYDPRPLEYIPLDSTRWGIKRAYGPTKHAIFLGMLLLLLTPWTLYAASRSLRRRGPQWWFWTPLAPVLGIVCTASRGPIVAVAVALAAALFLLAPRTRVGLAALAGIAALVVVLQFNAVLDGLNLWGGESRLSPRDAQVEIDGQMRRRSTVEMRIYLFSVYDDAMRRAGLLGFGTTAVTGFPVNVPVGPENVDTLKRVRFIDNIYVLTVLRFGYLGLAAFVALLGATIADWSRRALARQEGSTFAAAAAGSLAGAALAMLTVWMPQDFGFVILWTAGAGAGLRASAAAMGSSRQRHESHPRAAGHSPA